jgi:transcriptional regulator with XRE-family HTH domain
MLENKSKDPSPEALISCRVREERLKRGWTLVELSERAKVSRAMISKIERGTSSPTAVLLDRLAGAMGLSVTSLMSERPHSRSALRRFDDQPLWRDPATGYSRRLVSPAGDEGDAEVVAIDLPAGVTINFEALGSLRADVQVLLFEGQLQLELGERCLDLAPGDCARIAVDQPHAFRNVGKSAARYLVVMRHWV